ncbi:amidohydrolase family protein [Granulicoccus sp. GXG6511]|uniref:amidohydrolase family protein n=1 Tax=Granulicoccus sp. GXG6511 TaxID=3381351 RepID=UPI003D7CA053
MADSVRDGGPVVDVHAHAMPMPLLEWLASEGLADLSRVEADKVVILDTRVSGVGAGAPLPLARSMYDADLRLSDMDDQGVTHQAISLPPFLMGSTCDDEDLVVELVRRGNDALAEYVAGSERLLGLVGVPLGFAEGEREVRRGLDQLGMPGAAIGSQGAGRDLDDDANTPVWRLLSERSVFTFLHPSGVPAPARMKDFWFPQLLGYPMETAIATARMIFSGRMEAHPFPLCLAHGGGCVPSVRPRLQMGWERKDVARTTKRPPRDLFNELYFDTAVFDPTALQRLIEDVGADHVLVGTDYPFDLADRDPAGSVAEVSLGGGAREAILGRTAAKLLGIRD